MHRQREPARRHGERTPTGTFLVNRKVAGPEQTKLGVSYSPNYFNRGIAVRGVPNVLAQSASHGCVRIPMELARPIHDAMRMGMQVVMRT